MFDGTRDLEMSNWTPVAVVGLGQVGSELLRQLRTRILNGALQGACPVRVVAVANSRKMHVNLAEGIKLDRWVDDLDCSDTATNLATLAESLAGCASPAVIIDATASSSVAGCYQGWIDRGLSVVAANKLACSGPHAEFARLHATARSQHSGLFRYETTVGAGLPIVETAKSLAETGDEVIQIEGILSGTLSYLFSLLESGARFSECVTYLTSRGYTEPDPLMDLNGSDVVRKLCILVRQFGDALEVSDIRNAPLLPTDDFQRSGTDWTAYDDYFFGLVRDARSQNQCLRHVARYTKGEPGFVGLSLFSEDHPFARLNPADNVVQFRTKRYFSNPLIVRGPGAGPSVTAAGLQADLIKVCRELRASTQHGRRKASV